MPKVEISETTRLRSIGTAQRFQLSASRSSTSSVALPLPGRQLGTLNASRRPTMMLHD